MNTLKFIWNKKYTFLFYLAALCGLIGFPLEVGVLKAITYIGGGIVFLRIYISAWRLIIGSYKSKEWIIAIVGTVMATAGLVFVICMLSDVIWDCTCW